MFSRWPVKQAWAMRGAVAASWVGIGVAGYGGTFFTARSVVAAAEPTWLVVAGSAAALVGAVLGFLGIIIGGMPKRLHRWWRLEWLGAALSGAGLVYYCIIPWIYMSQGHTERIQQAGVTMAMLFGFLVFRLIHCWAYGEEQLRLHEIATGEVKKLE